MLAARAYTEVHRATVFSGFDGAFVEMGVDRAATIVAHSWAGLAGRQRTLRIHESRFMTNEPVSSLPRAAVHPLCPVSAALSHWIRFWGAAKESYRPSWVDSPFRLSCQCPPVIRSVA